MRECVDGSIWVIERISRGVAVLCLRVSHGIVMSN